MVNRFIGSQATWIKAVIILLCVLHTIYLVVATLGSGLGPNPVESLTHITGEWGLRLLLLTLAITPFKRLFHWGNLQRFRRLLGLCSFFYIVMHFMIYLVFDHFFDIIAIVEDIVEHPYIAVGFAAFVLMLPLAVTSISSIQRRMGRWWLRLHRCVYLVAILGVLHYWWLVKADVFVPLIYAAILLLLFLPRLYFFVRKKYG